MTSLIDLYDYLSPFLIIGAFWLGWSLRGWTSSRDAIGQAEADTARLSIQDAARRV